ncbi:hypothetical protein [Streptomyces sp. IB2014 016-6]|uniref:hypothetical protein n=1 Tax=Streptomyces sp. IB2014 016-6 TaxID=2517818 RepID=UPI0011C8F5C9|nr:hypothetical protein [Streptomyces sp. IB2014 016-6]TXL91585.1 hypothetical protein EW053_04465 [Streptomyces sp. IB2014 016-6]
MADLVNNISKGRFVHYGATAQAGTGGAKLVAVVLAAAGLGTDDQLQDAATLTAVLAVATEQTTMGRKTLSGVTAAVNNTANTASIDAADVTWTAAGGAATGKLVICFDPTGSSADGALVPLTVHDFAVTPDGTDITAQISVDGLAVAQNA